MTIKSPFLYKEKRLINENIVPTSAPAGKIIHNQLNGISNKDGGNNNSISTSRLDTPITKNGEYFKVRIFCFFYWILVCLFV